MAGCLDFQSQQDRILLHNGSSAGCQAARRRRGRRRGRRTLSAGRSGRRTSAGSSRRRQGCSSPPRHRVCARYPRGTAAWRQQSPRNLPSAADAVSAAAARSHRPDREGVRVELRPVPGPQRAVCVARSSVITGTSRRPTSVISRAEVAIRERDGPGPQLGVSRRRTRLLDGFGCGASGHLA